MQDLFGSFDRNFDRTLAILFFIVAWPITVPVMILTILVAAHKAKARRRYDH